MKNQMHLLTPTLTTVLLLTLTPTLIASFDDNQQQQRFENSAHICERCDCRLADESVTLDCANRSFTKVLADWPNQPDQLIATFSYNAIETLDTLPGTGAQLKVCFDHCGIERLVPGVFSSTVNVTYVDLSYNAIKSSELSADVFKGPYNNTMYEPIALRYLNLAYNQIHSLQKDVFEHTPFLEVLNLEGNDFRIIDPVTQLALSTITNVQVLNLANNRLTDLTDGAVKHFANLRELDLSKNELDFIPLTLGFVATTLERLYVNQNPIVELADESFVGLSNLMVLSANNLTELKTIKANTFAPLKNLRVLRLTQCPKLEAIDRQAFGDHPSLREVYLNDNVLTDIDPQLLSWGSLTTLHIHGNQFFCTCALYNFSALVPLPLKSVKDAPMCMDAWRFVSYQIYFLQKDICDDQPLASRHKSDIYVHFNALKTSLIVLSVVLVVSTTVALFLGWSKWRSYQRNRGYPFVSNVIYNPINTTLHMGPS